MLRNIRNLNKVKTQFFQKSFSSSSIEKQIAENPAHYYEKFKQRLSADGMLAPFPEFAKPVQFLEKALNKPSIISLCQKNTTLNYQKHMIKNRLFHLKFNFIIDGKDYPHVPPYKAPYPYLPTILSIQDTLAFLDNCVRTNYQHVSKLYHTDRYFYHTFGFYEFNSVKNPYILFPTSEQLSLTHFVKTRSVPLGFLGIDEKPIFADGYYNSPLDFYVHDINHARRYHSMNNVFFKENPDVSLDLGYKKFDDFIKNIVLPDIEMTQELKPEEKSLRQIIQVLYFELMHEFALPPDKKAFIDAFKHKPDAPSPFEHMITDDFNPSELERIRMANNNLYSGYDTHKFSREITIRYFFDKGTNFLNSAYNKSINGFYDTYLQRYMSLPPLSQRTPEIFQKAARHILTRLNANDLMTDEEILALINSKSFLEIYPNTQIKKPTRRRR